MYSDIHFRAYTRWYLTGWLLQKSHAAIHCATEMSYIHNTILRGLNSIYLQAPLVNSPHDIRDLLFFCGAWVKMAKHHHEIEESGFFPAIEKFTQKPGLMEGKIQQIHEFLPGMHRFLEYVQSTSPEEHRWESFEDIVDSFAPVLVKHLKDTIDTLLALVEYDSDGLMKMYRGFEKIAANSSHPNLYVSFPKVYGSIRAQLSTVRHKNAVFTDSCAWRFRMKSCHAS